MEKIFLDTSFLFAYHNIDDAYHEKSINLVNEIANNNMNCFISDYIFDEILALLLSRVNKLKAIEVCNKLINEVKSGNIELKYIDNEVFLEALGIFIQFEDKEWSFTDCTSYVIIKNEGIEKAAAFDRHFRQFRQFGIEILPS